MTLSISNRRIKDALSNYTVQPSTMDELIELFYDTLDTPLASKCKTLYKEGKHDELLQQSVNPADYNSADGFHLDYLAVKFLSKATFLKTSFDVEKVAYENFELSESECRETNLRFNCTYERESSKYGAWLYVMRWKIDKILGEVNFEEILDLSDWGPGVSTLIKGLDTSATRKYQSEMGITDGAYALIGHLLTREFPNWFRSQEDIPPEVLIQDGDRVTTVSKNAKTDRTILINPGLNLYFQKGCGQAIKRRMERVGVDLTHQQTNAELAELGSLTGDLATVDFSRASDSMATAMVREVLPEDWFNLLSSFRCVQGTIGGQKRRWEKFSSMGNGFTWELESLIFYTAALTTCAMHGIEDTKLVSVFGDDVIIPSEVYDSYVDFCAYLGFTINRSKSYAQGPFRESCGSHWFDGFDVKPIYLVEPLRDVLCLYKLANSIRLLAHRRCFNSGCDSRFLPYWRSVVRRIPKPLRLRISAGFGDGGLVSNLDEACPPLHSKDGWEGYDALSVVSVGVKHDTSVPGMLNARLRQITGGLLPRRWPFGRTSLLEGTNGLSNRAFNNNETLRDLVNYRVKPILIVTWYDLGPWQ